MKALSALPPLHEDALRELCNVCGGRAADALSRLLGDAPVDLDLPETKRLGPDCIIALLGGPAAHVVAARVDLQGPLRGELWFLLDERDASTLSGRLDGSGSKGDVAPLVLYETANIVASACLNAVYALTRMTVLPSVPEVVHARADEVVRKLAPRSNALALSVDLVVRQASVRGRILVFPGEESVPKLLSAMGLAA